MSSPPSLRRTLEDARQRLAAEDEAQRTVTGPVIAAIDRALALLDGAATAATGRHPTPPPNPQMEIEALRRENERLRALADREHGLWEAVLHHSPHAIIVADAVGRLVLHNAAAERIWAGSATANSVADWSYYRAFHPDGRPFRPEDWSMARSLSSREVVDVEEIPFQRFDDRHGVLLGSSAPILGAHGELLGAVAVFADITRFKQVEQENARLYREARHALQVRDDFLSIAGHELRSPVGALALTISSLARASAQVEQLPGRMRERIAGAHRQVRRLTSLVRSLLEVSRIETGRLDLELEEVDLVEIAREVAERMGEEAARRGVALSLIASAPARGQWDGLRLDQVLTNLVSNALRYGEGGPVEITVEPTSGGARATVRDHGPGVPPEDRERIFERFQRAGKEYGGLGLGLWITRQIMTAHGGVISVESVDGGGCRFVVELPTERSSE